MVLVKGKKPGDCVRIFSVPHWRRRMEELEGSYRLHATEMVSGFLTD